MNEPYSGLYWLRQWMNFMVSLFASEENLLDAALRPFAWDCESACVQSAEGVQSACGAQI